MFASARVAGIIDQDALLLEIHAGGKNCLIQKHEEGDFEDMRGMIAELETSEELVVSGGD
jgi:hypothetical protein